jgi:anti-anti-sigma regulatory factor
MGRLILCRLNPLIRQLYQYQRLDRVFQIVSSVEEALAALNWSLAIDCPVAVCEGDALSHDPSIADRGGELCCRSCGCRFQVVPFQLSRGGEARVAVRRFEIPTYEQEQIRAELDVIVPLHVVGRLDLFAAEALVDAWRSLPGSSRVLLDLRAATELSKKGLRLLEKHFRDNASGDRFVALVDPDRSDRTRAALSGIRVTTAHDEAMSILGGSSDSDEKPVPLLVSARTV